MTETYKVQTTLESVATRSAFEIIEHMEDRDPLIIPETPVEYPSDLWIVEDVGQKLWRDHAILTYLQANRTAFEAHVRALAFKMAAVAPATLGSYLPIAHYETLVLLPVDPEPEATA